MLALALFGMREIDRKARRRDPIGFAAFEARTSVLPFAAIAEGRNRLVWSEIGWWRLALAALLYAILIGAHPHVIGVSPLGCSYSGKRIADPVGRPWAKRRAAAPSSGARSGRA